MSSTYYAFDHGRETSIVQDDDPHYGSFAKTERPIGPYDSLPDAVLGAQKRGNTPFMEYQGHTCRLSFYTSMESFGIFVESANGLTMEIPLPHVTDVAEYVKHGGRTRGEIQRGELGLDV